MLALTLATSGGATLGGAHDLLARTLVFVVLTAGVLAALVALLSRARGRAPAPTADETGLPETHLSATHLSATHLAEIMGAAFAGVDAALLAIGLGGPGALPWLVLAGLVGAAIHRAEGGLLRSTLAAGTGLPGHVLGVSHALAASLAALTAGALLHSHQAAEAVGAAGPIAPWAVGLGLAALVLGALRGPGRWLGPVAVVALAVHVALMLLLLAQGGLSPVLGDMFAQALGGEAALAGLLAAAAQGVLRAAVAGATGSLGHAGGDRGGTGGLGGLGGLTWLAPVLTAGVALLTGLAALTAGVTTPEVATRRELLPLERHLRGGLTPSEHGQLIVLPPDAGLEEGQRYPMVLRADPRGHLYGGIFRDENIVAAPAWDFTRTVDTVILRDSDPERGKNPGFDVRIAVRRELVDTKVGPFLKLHPIDPTVNIRQLMETRDLAGPFLNVADFQFVGGVARGFRMQGGERLSMFEEPRAADAPRNPALRDIVTFNYSGPYFDRGEPPAPLALAAPIDGGLQPGRVAHLRMDPPARGLELGFVNRLGELEVPAWAFLGAADTAVLRHPDDPTQDRTITVRSRLQSGRLRFTSPDIDLEKLAKRLPGYTGPFLRPPSYHFAAEVHHGARLPAEFAETHVALVPVHQQRAPAGNPGPGTYDPHPGEVLLTGMQGPTLDQDGAGLLVRAIALRFGPALAGLGAGALVVLALAGLLYWLRAGLRSACLLLGARSGVGFGLVFLVCAALGPALELTPLLRVADAAVALAVLLGTARLLAYLPRLARRDGA